MGYMSADAAERWLYRGLPDTQSNSAIAKTFDDAIAQHRKGERDPSPAQSSTSHGRTSHDNPSHAPTVKTTIDHTVVPGDTIWDLGVTYGSNVDAIVGVNPQFRPGSGDSRYNAAHERTLTTNRDADAIWPGEVLKIPVDAPAPPVEAAPEPVPLDPLPPAITPSQMAPHDLRPTIQPPATNQACAVTAPYSAYADPLADAAMWGKQGTFATRVLTRLGFEGLTNGPARFPGPLASIGPGINSASKVVGLGGFGILNSVQKGAEVVNYAQDGDWGRMIASGAEGLNGLRIGATGITPLLKAGNAAWVSKYMGGATGTKLGIGANVVAGAGRAYSIEQQYNQATACADTPRESDQAQYDRVDAHLGNVLDTGNDIVPYIGDHPINWGTWLAGKGMDHWAASALDGSGYKPRSIGADHSRNLMPLLAATGAVPTVEYYDVSTAKTEDERIVMEESNSVHKAAGISAGVADVTVTAVEVGLASYYGRKPEVVYGVLQADHALRQGANIWTDHAWQRPDERAAAVEAVGLNPALDPHRIEYEQEDFVHRSAASMSADFNIARLEGKVSAGGATADEKRYLEIVEQFESADISNDTNGRGSNDGILSPHGTWEILKITQPGLAGAERLPDFIGFSTGWVQGGGIGNTVEAVENKVGEAKDAVVDFAEDAGDLAGDVAGGVIDFASSAPKKLWGWL